LRNSVTKYTPMGLIVILYNNVLIQEEAKIDKKEVCVLQSCQKGEMRMDRFRSEKLITLRIQKFLASLGAWQLKIVGNQFMRTGVPDILVCYKGFFLALEVKRPGETPTKIQVYEMDRIKDAGGISEVVRSIEDVRELIDTIDVQFHEWAVIELERMSKG